MPSRHTTRTSLVTVAAASGLLLAGLVAPASAATTSGDIAGTVYVDGKPLAGAMVQLYRNHDSDPGGDGDDGTFTRLKTVNSDAKGRYAFSDLKLRTHQASRVQVFQYRVLVTDRTGRAVKTVRVVKPKTGKTTKRDVNLPEGAIVKGNVKRADGGSPADLSVVAGTTGDMSDELAANPQFVPDTRADVSASGSFTLKRLQRGSYENIVVSGGPYAAQCYDLGSNTLTDCKDDAAQILSVKGGETRTLAPVTISKRKPPVSTLRGTVKDPAGRPLKGIRVELVPVGGTPLPSAVLTRSTGRFAYRDAAPGKYTIRLTDTVRTDGYATWQKQYLDGVASLRSARVITVADGKPVNGLDATLKSATKVRSATKIGASSVKIAFDITRQAPGSKPGGTVTLTSDDRTAKETVVKGKVTVRITGLPKGTSTIKATYSGTGSTAGFTKTFRVKLR